MAAPQPGIFALGTLAHAYVELDLAEDATPAGLVRAVASLEEPRTTMGGVNLVSGFRPEVWDGPAPDGLHGFTDPVVGPDGFTMPATQHDAVLWVSGGSYDVVFDAAIGVLVGVLLSGVFFAGKVSRLSRVTSELSADGETRTYKVAGQVFFASAGTFAEAIDVTEPVSRIVIDVHEAHFWDISAVGALDRIVLKARRHGREVEVIGLNEASATMVERFATHDKDNAPASVGAH